MEEEKYQTQSKWQGKASAELKRMSPERAWPALANFCNLHKWFPTVSACRQVEGVPGQPDLFRYCASAPVDYDESTIKWSEEKLLTIDPIQRRLSYEVTESNLGFKSYVATKQLVAMDSGDGCRIEWSFVSDPIEGWGLDDFLSYLDSSVQLIGKTIMEHPSLSATTT
ncbi:hypothetical protein ACFX2F_017029 [Malus domestica]|uniref:lachrymatory-factor synthase-like n=1 Tax=Malus domestica TaxID=3750 RepID=UPI000498DD4B|nr:lachrymatory-factor synthase-like [Malus domestica]